MTSPATLGADDLRAVMGGYRDALRLHQTDINRLNVYPVPDGDTGHQHGPDPRGRGQRAGRGRGRCRACAEVCKAIGHGSLMGARGNSGVILSQLLRGMSERMAAAGEAGVGPDLLVDAITHAAELARRAVVRPVEGTILTVASAAADGRRQRLRHSWASWRARGARRPTRLARTPEMLPVLAQAGVVDAGGAGFLLLLDAFLLVLDGRPLPEPSGVDGTRPLVAQRGLDRRVGTGSAVPGDGGRHAVGDLRYEVMYLLSAARRVRSRPSRRCGPASATPSSSSAATACGTATSTPTTSARPSRPASTPGGPRASG